MALENISVSEKNKTYHSINNCIVHTKKQSLVLGCKTSIIPDDGSVNKIAKNAFYGCNSLENILIPDVITSIGDSAFSKCESLTSITIPNSVTKIGKEAFLDCVGLKSITIPDSVTKIGKDVFRGCADLTIFTTNESYAQKYAQKNKIKIELI
jgi:hypothetical protein